MHPAFSLQNLRHYGVFRRRFLQHRYQWALHMSEFTIYASLQDLPQCVEGTVHNTNLDHKHTADDSQR